MDKRFYNKPDKMLQDIYLYNSGDECTSITGGYVRNAWRLNTHPYWSGGYKNVDFQEDKMSFISSRTHEQMPTRTEIKINPYGYSKLIIEFTPIAYGDSSCNLDIAFSETELSASDWAGMVHWTKRPTSSELNKRLVWAIDLTEPDEKGRNIEDKFYNCLLGMFNNSGYSNFELHSIKLEV